MRRPGNNFRLMAKPLCELQDRIHRLPAWEQGNRRQRLLYVRLSENISR
jgi:hypothetical protein